MYLLNLQTCVFVKTSYAIAVRNYYFCLSQVFTYICMCFCFLFLLLCNLCSYFWLKTHVFTWLDQIQRDCYRLRIKLVQLAYTLQRIFSYAMSKKLVILGHSCLIITNNEQPSVYEAQISGSSYRHKSWLGCCHLLTN